MSTLVERCCCGGVIRADSRGVAPAVRAHAASSQHRAWRWPGLVLGPCPCSLCGEPLAWDGKAWHEAGGGRHRCAGRMAA